MVFSSITYFYLQTHYMNNPDLQSVVGSDSQKLFEHFYTCGMAEGRRASENFDVSVYKANNPDLVAVFGDDLKAYYTHYVQSGQLENRLCETFSVKVL